jgi:hypothetical protein
MRTHYNVAHLFDASRVHVKEGLRAIVESVSNRTVLAHLTDMGVRWYMGDQRGVVGTGCGSENGV